jgi:hypothetical protein
MLIATTKIRHLKLNLWCKKMEGEEGKVEEGECD